MLPSPTVASLIPRLAPGSTFAERFRIVAYVGQGSMGSVYRAQAPDGQVVALKIVNLAAAPDARTERRFLREVESGARIDSPHVARTLDSGKLGEGGLAWLALEFAEGVGLDELISSRGALRGAEARTLLEQVFAALSAAHRAGIVHRDLKPENVRVEAETLRVKVLDFGIAKDFGVGTLSGTTPGLGTPLWTAPEQAREGYEPLASSDVWALGLVTFFVLTGKPYWRKAAPRASMADLAVELLKSEIEPASRRAAELDGEAPPRGFDAWFARAVHRDPSQRFEGAAEAWAALEPVLRPGTAERAASRERPTLVVRPLAFVTVVISSCVVAGLVIYWLLRSMRV